MSRVAMVMMCVLISCQCGCQSFGRIVEGSIFTTSKPAHIRNLEPVIERQRQDDEARDRAATQPQPLTRGLL